MISVLDSTLSEKKIADALEKLKSSKYITDFTINSTINITYVPSVKLSYGYNDARIDIKCNGYN